MKDLNKMKNNQNLLLKVALLLLDYNNKYYLLNKDLLKFFNYLLDNYKLTYKDSRKVDYLIKEINKIYERT